MFKDGNPHAHNMSEDGMDEWTKNEDELTAMRCAHTCWRVGCQEGVEIALAFEYHDVVATARVRTETWHTTPWTYWCSKHADDMLSDEEFRNGQYEHYSAIRFFSEEE